MTENCRQIVKLLNCKYELFENLENDIPLIDQFNEWTRQGKEAGFYPLIIVPSDVLIDAIDIAFEDIELEITPENFHLLREQFIKEADTIDPEDFLLDRLNEYSDMYEEEELVGTFTETKPSHCFYSYMDNNKPAPEIILAQIPANHPWELAAWIPMGGFNDCPSPAAQVAVFKKWYHTYEASPAVVTYDNWELELQKPPTIEEEALSLAKEHFAFSSDNVTQAAKNFASLRGLASSLKNSTTWFFWWD